MASLASAVAIFEPFLAFVLLSNARFVLFYLISFALRATPKKRVCLRFRLAIYVFSLSLSWNHLKMTSFLFSPLIASADSCSFLFFYLLLLPPFFSLLYLNVISCDWSCYGHMWVCVGCVCTCGCVQACIGECRCAWVCVRPFDAPSDFPISKEKWCFGHMDEISVVRLLLSRLNFSSNWFKVWPKFEFEFSLPLLWLVNSKFFRN